MSSSSPPSPRRARAAAPAADDKRARNRWEAARDEHQVALAAYLDTAAALSDEAWTRPWAPGKWTPAQLTEHLSLAYEALLTELATGQGMREKLHGWRQRVTRWIFLPHILFHRSFPLKVRAPREIRPSDPATLPRPEALRRMRELGERAEQELDRARRAGGGWITHPYFGKIEPVKGLRFVAVHIEHHQRQVARAK
jgi:hypothetical protein